MKTTLGLIGLAFALSSFLIPPEASAATPQGRCRMVDIDQLQAKIAKGEAFYLTDGQLQFARALFITTPPVVWQFPMGDKAFLIPAGEEGHDVVIFLDTATSCERLILGEGASRLLDDVRRGVTMHAGDGL